MRFNFASLFGTWATHARGRVMIRRAETEDHLPESNPVFHKISRLDFMPSHSAESGLLPFFYYPEQIE
jgi:hypothetical protein